MATSIARGGTRRKCQYAQQLLADSGSTSHDTYQGAFGKSCVSSLTGGEAPSAATQPTSEHPETMMPELCVGVPLPLQPMVNLEDAKLFARPRFLTNRETPHLPLTLATTTKTMPSPSLATLRMPFTLDIHFGQPGRGRAKADG